MIKLFSYLENYHNNDQKILFIRINPFNFHFGHLKLDTILMRENVS